MPADGTRASLTITPATLGLSGIPAGQYRLEAYARSGSTAPTDFFLYATIDGVTTDFAIPNTNTWTNRQLPIITVPPGITQFEIGIRVNSNMPGGGWGQFDDFSLTYIG
jgi:hypothetical protein